MVLGMVPVRGQDANNSDRQYWIQTIVKIADPVINNLSKDQLNLKSATPFPKCYLHKEKWTFDS